MEEVIAGLFANGTITRHMNGVANDLLPRPGLAAVTSSQWPRILFKARRRNVGRATFKRREHPALSKGVVF